MTTTEILTGVKNWVSSKLSLKQDVINDLADIRSGSQAGSTAVQPSDLSSYFNNASYDTNTHRINFYHGQNIVAYVDASPFIVDGMVDDVRIENGYLVIDFNTESGKQDISIPLTDIFDPSNYYNKTRTDGLLAQKQDVIQDLANIRSGAGAGATAVQPEELNSALSNTVAESGIFDLSVHNAVNGVPATYDSLSAAITALNALPATYKTGGMSFKFIHSSDNKYVQCRYISDSTAVADFVNTDNWQECADSVTLQKRLVTDYYLKIENILPDGYTQLKSITGNSSFTRIDTGIICANDLEIECTFKDNGWASFGGFFGRYTDENTNAIRLIYTNTNNNKGYIGFNTKASSAIEVSGIIPNAKHHVIFNKSNFIIDGITRAITTTTQGTAQDGTIILNGVNLTAGTGERTITWYDFVIRKNNIVVFDGKPCRRLSDGAIGMYDIVSSQFLQNAIDNSSVFIGGSENSEQIISVDKVDNKLTAGSRNLIESGAVEKKIYQVEKRIGKTQISFISGRYIGLVSEGNTQPLTVSYSDAYKYAIIDVSVGEILDIRALATVGACNVLDENNIVTRNFGNNANSTIVIANNEKKVIINNRVNNDYVSYIQDANNITKQIENINSDIETINSDITSLENGQESIEESVETLNDKIGDKNGKKIDFIEGYLVRVGPVGQQTSIVPESNSAYSYAVVDVDTGDIINLHTYASTNVGQYEILDSNNIVTRRSIIGGELEAEITIADGEKKIVINNNINYDYVSYIKKADAIYTQLEYLDNIKSGRKTTPIMYPDTIIVAAANSSDDDKKIANYVCTGTNDEVTINSAIADLVYGGTVQLCYGTYYVDSFNRINGTLFKSAIGVADNGNFRHIIIQGNVLPLGVYGSQSGIKYPVIRVTEECYNALDNDIRVAVIGNQPGKEWYNHRSAISVKNLCISLPNCTKPVIGISHIHSTIGGCEHVNISNDATTAYIINPVAGERAPQPNPLSVGIYGHHNANSNPYCDYRFCLVSGFAVGFEIGGDHNTLYNCWAGRCIIAYSFGVISNCAHHNSLYNCCCETNSQAMRFGAKTGDVIEPILISNFQIEVGVNRSPLVDANIINKLYAPPINAAYESSPETAAAMIADITQRFVTEGINYMLATEIIPNTQWCGEITYSCSPVDTPFFEDGQGRLFKVRNMRNPLSGTTANRPPLPNYLEQYFDTSLNKMMTWNGNDWV